MAPIFISSLRFWDRLAETAERNRKAAARARRAAERERKAAEHGQAAVAERIRQLAAELGEPDPSLPWRGESGKDVLQRCAFVEEPPKPGETLFIERPAAGDEYYCLRIVREVRVKGGRDLSPKYVWSEYKRRNKALTKTPKDTKKRR
jgi:hypothetical protein